jgi:uncharacterized protein (TIGR02145 family)
MQPQVLTLSGKRLAVGGKTVFRNSTAVIGGHTYKTVRIGNQEWLAENLKYDDSGEGIKLRTASTYDGEYYYTWAASDRVASSIGDGWRLPSKSDYETLADAAGGIAEAGKLLKSTSGWDDNDNGVDTFGFAIIAAGFYNGTSGSSYASGGNMGYFWTKTESDESKKAYGIYATTGYDGLAFSEPYKSSGWFSVRLVRNVNYMATIGSNRYRTVTIGDQEWLAENLREDDGSQYVHTFDGEKYYEHYRGSNAYTLQLGATLADGWHLPSNAEYSTLYTYVGGASTAGQMLKSESGWNNNNGLNKYGFNALPYDNEVHYIAGGGGVPSYHVDHEPVRGGFSFFATSTVTNYRNNYTAMLASGNNANIGENANEPAYSRYMNVRLVRPAINYTFIGDRMYKTVKIGSQIWLAENLRLDDGGTGIYTNSSGTYAGEKFYNWDAAMRVSALVGNGWRLPSKTDFETLATSVGGSDIAGTALKSTFGWNSSGNGSNEYRFEAVAAGYLSPPGVNFDQGSKASFWSTTHIENPPTSSICSISATSASISMAYQEMEFQLTLRLVKDA